MKAALAWAALLVLPLVIHDEVVLTILTFTFFLGVFAVSLNLIFGYTCQLSMFHAAAFGIAAYTTQLSATYLGVSFWIGMLIGIAVVSAISLVVGAICFRFRLKAFYFSIVTLAFAEMARMVILNWPSFTNGSLGITADAKPTVLLPGGVVPVDGPLMWYYLGFVTLFVCVAFFRRLLRSWVGRCFVAIRINEELADTLGINVFRYKLISFLVANAWAAIAGTFYTFYIGYIAPDYLSTTQSLSVTAMVLLGGTGSVVSPVVGAFVLTALPLVGNFSANVQVMLDGLILIFVILFLPRGIVGTIDQLNWGHVTEAAARVLPRGVMKMIARSRREVA